MMMSGPLLVSMAEAIRGLRSFMLIRSAVTSTPAIFANSPASRLNSTSEAGTKLTHVRMLSFVPFGKLGAFCAATIVGIPPATAAPVAAPATLRNARRSSFVTPPGFAIAHSPGSLDCFLTRALRNAGDHNTAYRRLPAPFPHKSPPGRVRQAISPTPDNHAPTSPPVAPRSHQPHAHVLSAFPGYRPQSC